MDRMCSDNLTGNTYQLTDFGRGQFSHVEPSGDVHEADEIILVVTSGFGTVDNEIANGQAQSRIHPTHIDEIRNATRTLPTIESHL